MEIEWRLLVMFVGLFIVVAVFEKTVLTPETVAAIGRLRLDDKAVLGTATALLSNVVSNVPAVLVLKPFVPSLPDPHRAWLVIAMTATLARHLTMVGSVAHLILAHRARARGA